MDVLHFLSSLGQKRDHTRGEGANLQDGRHQGPHHRGAGGGQGVQEADG